MTTPICDFVNEYANKNTIRLHMPGHTGINLLGMEHIDLTEIDGADSLYEAEGIIAESEANATSLFGCDTFYSTEGSSQCIRAMLYLACVRGDKNNERPLIFAGRNAHKTFLSAAALIDFDIEWLYGEEGQSYLSCKITAGQLENKLQQAKIKPEAVYITSPDYLGNVADIKALAKVCHRYGVMLLVDNAHGAYFKFLSQSLHPIDLGADMCCDSAHKTLPVLTGGAYLHVSQNMSDKSMIKNALAMFGSTSPSYIILQSLDKANHYIDDGYLEKLEQLCIKVQKIKDTLVQKGFELIGDEKIKISISTKSYGYTGKELAQILTDKNIICEFCDPDFIVFMFAVGLSDSQLEYFTEVICNIPKKTAINDSMPKFFVSKQVMSVRQAAFSECEYIPVEKSEGKVLAASSVGCPPAVPIVVCGEVINEQAIKCFNYYGIGSCCVIK